MTFQRKSLLKLLGVAVERSEEGAIQRAGIYFPLK